MAQIEAAGPALYFVHADHLGTPDKLTDATKAIVWDAALTPWGEVETQSGTVQVNIRLPGQYHDQETGLSYNWHRDYDPTTGRYMQSDPIGLVGGINRYAYVNGNPVSLVDPTGEEAVTAGIGAVVGGYVGYQAGGWKGAAAGAAAGGIVGFFAPSASSTAAGIAARATLGGLAAWDIADYLRQLLCGDGLTTADHLWAAAGVFPAARFGKLAARGAGKATTLYRAVGPRELADIQALGRFRVAPGGTEGKYFFKTPEQASNFVRMMGDKPYTTTSVRVSPAELGRGQAVNPAREGPGYFFSTPHVPGGPASILNFSVVP